jgi:rhamnosyltransferase
VRYSIVIRCYNEEKNIGRLLSGILEQTITDVEIIIVDSGSNDSTIAVASQYPAKILRIRPEEFSFGRALNAGCQYASGDVIIIASAHVYPIYNDWLESLTGPFADPQVALVYGKQRGNELTKYSEHQIFAKWFPVDSDMVQEHPFCNNANAAIRKTVWEHLPYDESLTGLEDVDWAKRAMPLGYRVAYSAEAEVVHVHNERFKSIYNRYRREAMALKRIFPQERFSLWDFTRLLVSNVASDYYHALRDGVWLENLLGILLFRFVQLGGSYHGFATSGDISAQLKQRFYYPNGLWRYKPVEANNNPRSIIRYDHGGLRN